jgi:hypothetical protein
LRWPQSEGRLPAPAAILGNAVKKRAVSVAADPSACCDNGLHG